MAHGMVNIANNTLASRQNDKLQINSRFHSSSLESVLAYMWKWEKRPTVSQGKCQSPHIRSFFLAILDSSDSNLFFTSCLFRKQIHFTRILFASLVGNLGATQIDWFAAHIFWVGFLDSVYGTIDASRSFTKALGATKCYKIPPIFPSQRKLHYFRN